MKMYPTLFPVPGDPDGMSNLLVLPALFSETMNMIFESYDYFEKHDAEHRDTTPPEMQTIISNEMSRVTMRLTSIMAWLMARKAVIAGQISPQDAEAQYRMDGAEYCIAHFKEINAMLPLPMIDLLERSHRLYMRVWRLDQIEGS